MSNLSIKEKFLIFIVGLIVVCVAVYFLVISPLQSKIVDASSVLASKEVQDRAYEELKQSNSNASGEIDKVRTKIKGIEASLLANIETDSIENYVMSVFERNGSYYLSKIESSDIGTDLIYLPNGEAAQESLLIKRITVEYSTTDGYTIPEYNGKPMWIDHGLTNQELIAESISKMGDYTDPRFQVVGYNEFIKSIDELSQYLPSCFKIHSVEIEDSQIGFMFLRAEIDVYSASLGSNRLLKDNDPAQLNITWSGEENIDVSNGLIGRPLFNHNPNSPWFLHEIAASKLQTFSNRPYCSYFSNAILSDIAEKGLSLYSAEGYLEHVSTASEMYAPEFEGININDIDED